MSDRAGRRAALALLVLALLATSPRSTFSALPEPQTPAAQARPATIPAVHGTTLTGQQVELPAALAGKTGVLVLGFSKDARVPVRDWGRRLAVDYATSSTIAYFDMPVLASVPRLLRGVVLKQIAADVSDRGKPHFLPITTDEPRWRELVQYSQPGDAYLLVVSGTGEVRATLSGPLTDTSYRTLQQEITAAATPR